MSKRVCLRQVLPWKASIYIWWRLLFFIRPSTLSHVFAVVILTSNNTIAIIMLLKEDRPAVIRRHGESWTRLKKLIFSAATNSHQNNNHRLLLLIETHSQIRRQSTYVDFNLSKFFSFRLEHKHNVFFCFSIDCDLKNIVHACSTTTTFEWLWIISTGFERESKLRKTIFALEIEW